jgi:hypothetical protein
VYICGNQWQKTWHEASGKQSLGFLSGLCVFFAASARNSPVLGGVKIWGYKNGIAFKFWREARGKTIHL